MTIEELDREQRRLVPKEDLAPFAGQWVALREGRVIAHDLDPVALRDNQEVLDTDMLMPVPSGGQGIFIL